MSPLQTQANVLPFLTACACLAPTFLSLGNHEWMLDQEDLDMIRSTVDRYLFSESFPLVVEIPATGKEGKGRDLRELVNQAIGVSL